MVLSMNNSAEIPVSPREDPSGIFLPSWLRNLIFAGALVLTLLSGKWLFLARLGWILLLIFYTLNLNYALYSLIFYAAFFCPTEYLPNPLLTVKHFHVAVMLTFLVQLFRNHFWRTLGRSLRQALVFYPFLYIFLCGVLMGLPEGNSQRPLRMIGNVTLVFLSFSYVFALIADREDLLRKGALFFVAAVALQVLIALYNHFADTKWLDIRMIHNNHLGILSAFSFFYAFSLGLGHHRRFFRWLGRICSLVIFVGVLFSCSRSAWLSLLIGYFIFYGLLGKILKCDQQCLVHFQKFFLLSCVLIPLAIYGVCANPVLLNRVMDFLDIFNPLEWRRALLDRQNFGFLGIFRLNQLDYLGSMPWYNYLWGRGLTSRIMDFHGFYFVVIGASGLLGILLLSVFCRKLIHGMLKAVQACTTSEEGIFRAGVLCAFIVWLLISFTETLYIQFYIWFNLFAAALIARAGMSPPGEAQKPR